MSRRNLQTALQQEISVHIAAALLDCTVRHVQRLTADGWISRPYTILGVTHGYIRSRDDTDKHRTQSANRERIEVAKAQMAELRLAKMSGELVLMTEVIEIMNFVLGSTKAALLGIPAQVCRDRETLAMLRNGIDEALARAADLIAAEAKRVSEEI